MASGSFSDLWKDSVPLPGRPEEECWLAGVGLAVELREGRSPCPELGREGREFFSLSLPGLPGEVRWWLLDSHRYFNRRAGVGSLLISAARGEADPHRIIVWPVEGLSRRELGDFLVRKACSLLLLRRGTVLLHASSVVFRGRAVVLVASSGDGKSSLAGAFLASGVPVLGDEIAPIEGEDGKFVVRPGLPLVDVLGDPMSKTSRAHMIGAGAESAGSPPPLGALYHLRPSRGREGGSSVLFQGLSPREAFEVLLRNTYNMVLRDEGILRNHHAFLAGIANGPGLTRVTFPPGRVPPAALRQAVVENLTRDGEGD